MEIQLKNGPTELTMESKKNLPSSQTHLTYYTYFASNLSCDFKQWND